MWLADWDFLRDFGGGTTDAQGKRTAVGDPFFKRWFYDFKRHMSRLVEAFKSLDGLWVSCRTVANDVQAVGRIPSRSTPQATQQQWYLTKYAPGASTLRFERVGFVTLHAEYCCSGLRLFSTKSLSLSAIQAACAGARKKLCGLDACFGFISWR